MKKFFILCLMAFVMYSCVNYTTPPTNTAISKEQARIEITINEDINQYKELKKWESYNDFFEVGYGTYKQTFPYSLEIGKTYYRYKGKKLEPFVINWLSFSGDEVWCSVTIDGETKTTDGFFNDYSNGSFSNKNYFGNYPIFKTIDDFGLWIESGSQQYVIPCGTLDEFIYDYKNLMFTESNCYFRKRYNEENDWSADWGIYPSYSFDNDGVKCHETDIQYVYYKDKKIHIVCLRKYASEEECRKGTLGEMGLMK